MAHKPTKQRPDNDPGFRVSETGDSSSPDFLKSNDDQPTEPEWHLKDLERPPDLQTTSLVEVNLDDGEPIGQIAEDKPPDQTATHQPKPQPVDLTPKEILPSTAQGKENTSPDPARPQADQTPHRSIGLVDEGAPMKETPLPSAASAPEETAYEKDARRHMSATLSANTSGLAKEAGQAKVAPATLVMSDGKSLRFPDGIRLNAGDIVECNNRRYRVKVQTGRPPQFYLKTIGLAALVMLAAVGLASFFTGPSTGTLTGVVVDAATGAIISGAEVTLSDGTTAKTNLAGMYTFPQLEPGEYEVQASMPGFTGKTQAITRSSDRDVVLPFALTPLFASSDKSTEKNADAGKTSGKSKAVEYGVLKLQLDFDDYIIYIDDRIFGKNIKKVSKMRPGKHRLTLEKNQYEEYRTEVNIRARRTTEISISIADLQRKTTPKQRAKSHFAEGKSALDDDHYRLAITQFDSALAEIAEYPEARQYRGWAYRKLGDIEHAAADLQAAAELYALASRYLEAVNCANLLIEIYPMRGEYHLMRSQYQTALGELKAAIDDCKAAVKTNKKSLTFRLALAEAYYHDEQFKNAAKEFEKARKAAGDPTDIYVRLILSYMYAGKDKDLVKRYYELADVASEEKMEKLRLDPEWQRVLQLIGPDEKHK